MVANVSTTSKIVVEKSTVPVKTAEAIEKVDTCLTLAALCLQAFEESRHNYGAVKIIYLLSEHW